MQYRGPNLRKEYTFNNKTLEGSFVPEGHWKLSFISWILEMISHSYFKILKVKDTENL